MQLWFGAGARDFDGPAKDSTEDAGEIEADIGEVFVAGKQVPQPPQFGMTSNKAVQNDASIRIP